MHSIGFSDGLGGSLSAPAPSSGSSAGFSDSRPAPAPATPMGSSTGNEPQTAPQTANSSQQSQNQAHHSDDDRESSDRGDSHREIGTAAQLAELAATISGAILQSVLVYANSQQAAPQDSTDLLSLEASNLTPAPEGSTTQFQIANDRFHGQHVNLWNAVGYVAEGGETLAAIAADNGLGLDEFLVLNPPALALAAESREPGMATTQSALLDDPNAVRAGSLYIVRHDDLPALMAMAPDPNAPLPAPTTPQPRPFGINHDEGSSDDSTSTQTRLYLPQFAATAPAEPSLPPTLEETLVALESLPLEGPLTAAQQAALDSIGLTRTDFAILETLPAQGPVTKEQSAVLTRLQTQWSAAALEEEAGMEPVTDPETIAQLNIDAGLPYDAIQAEVHWFQKNGRYFTPGYVVYDHVIKPLLSGSYGPWGGASDTPEFLDGVNGTVEGWPGLLDTDAWFAHGESSGPGSAGLPQSSKLLSESGLIILRVRNPVARYVPLEDMRVAYQATQRFVQDRNALRLEMVNAVHGGDHARLNAAIDALERAQTGYLNTVAPTFVDTHAALFDFSDGILGSNRGTRNPFLPGTSLATSGSASVLATGIRATLNSILGFDPVFKSSLAFNLSSGDPYRATSHWERFKATFDSKDEVKNGYTGESHDSAIQALRNLGIDGFNTARNASMMAAILGADSPQAMGDAFANIGYQVVGFTLGEALEKLSGYGANAALRGPLMRLVAGEEGPGTRAVAGAVRIILNSFGIKADNPTAFATYLQAVRGTSEIAGWETGGAIGWTIFDLTGADAAYAAGVAFYNEMSARYSDGEPGWNLLQADTTTQQLAYSTALSGLHRYLIFAGRVEKFAFVSQMDPVGVLQSIRQRSGNGAVQALARSGDEAKAFMQALDADQGFRSLVNAADEAILNGDNVALSRTIQALQDYVEEKAPGWIDDFGSAALRQAAREIAPDAAEASAKAYKTFVEALDSVGDDIAQEGVERGFKLGTKLGTLTGVAVDGLFMGADVLRMLDAETPQAFGAAFRNLVQQGVATSGGLAAAGIVSTVYGFMVAGSGGTGAAASPVAAGIIGGATEFGTSLTLDYALNHLEDFDALEQWASDFKTTYFPDATLAQVMFERNGPIKASHDFIAGTWAGVPETTKQGLYAAAEARRDAFADLGAETAAFAGDMGAFVDGAITDDTRTELGEARSGLSGWLSDQWQETTDTASWAWGGISGAASGIWNGATGLWHGAGGIYEDFIAAPTRAKAVEIYESMSPMQKLAVATVDIAITYGPGLVGAGIDEGKRQAGETVTGWLGSFFVEEDNNSPPLVGPVEPPASTWASGSLKAGVASLDWLNDMAAFVADEAAEGVTNTHVAVEHYLATHPEARADIEALIDQGASGAAALGNAFLADQERMEAEGDNLSSLLFDGVTHTGQD